MFHRCSRPYLRKESLKLSASNSPQVPRPRKPKPPEPADDEIREHVSRYLHERHKRARSAKSAAPKIGEIKSALKGLGVKQHRIVTNLLYVVQAGWAEVKTQAYIIQRGGKSVQVASTTYLISNRGIDKLEGPSKFQAVDRLAGINITNVQGVTVVGEGNVVDAKFELLFRHLDLLGAEIRSSDRLADREKLSYQAEIDTMKSQLMKPEPDRSIIATAWDSLKSVATLSGVATAIDRVRPFIENLLH